MALAMNISGYALITGGGSGIGRATALLLAREGASGIALADLNQQQMDFVKTEVEAAATRADFSCITIVVDVVDRNSVEAMVETTVKAFGRLDYAVNSAGIGHKAPAVDTTASDWDNVIAINLTGVFTSMQEELRQMLRQAPLVPATTSDAPAPRGSIVNISSVAGIVGIQQSSAYVASKHGVVGVTKTFALEHPEVKINAIAPGYIRTPMTAAPGEASRNARDKAANWTALKRFGLPEEIAEAIVWLLSRRSNFVHGTCLEVDGGYLAH